MDIKQLEQIMALLKQNEVTEFELEDNGVHIRLARAVPRQKASVVHSRTDLEPAIIATESAVEAGSSSASGQRALKALDTFTKVESPLVGTFYRKPSPDAEPFVKEGDVVTKGDTLCIVEAMKLMNEIEAPISGRIERILISDGHVVEYGEVLFLIDPGV